MPAQQRVYEAITLSEAVALLATNPLPPARCAGKVVITFDDGFRDFRTHAFPFLERAGISRDGVPRRPTSSASPSSPPANAWVRRMFRELCDAGVEFGSHSASHRRLVELGRRSNSPRNSPARRSAEDRQAREFRCSPIRSASLKRTTRVHGVARAAARRVRLSGGVTTAIGGRTERRSPLPSPPADERLRRCDASCSQAGRSLRLAARGPAAAQQSRACMAALGRRFAAGPPSLRRRHAGARRGALHRAP